MTSLSLTTSNQNGWYRKLQTLARLFICKPKHRDQPSPLDQSSLVDQPSLLNLPIDILMLIFPLLPLPSQVCFALACKPFYNLFSHVLDDEILSWPRLLASNSSSAILCPPSHPRSQLLRQLEDSNWIYCWSCRLKIHPRYQYPGGLSSPLLVIRGKLEQSVVDLCPCLAITFHDRKRLEEWVRTGFIDLRLSNRIRRAFGREATEEGGCCLVHRCEMVDHADAFVEMLMKITLSHDDLIIQTTYRLFWRLPLLRLPSAEPSRSPLLYARQYGNMEPIFLCPHISIIQYFLKPALGSMNECSRCHTSVLVLGGSADKFFTVIQGVRNLGTAEAKRKPWTSNSRHFEDDLERQWYRIGNMTTTRRSSE
ncbi:hypothetical protein BDW59DRAFT_162840 [Aspergillus cavernicola]|uniref:F-box domain-containing protein n=1 Tax=Aspergillus cavernicola TaxID=176166 RepID=A0ABR4I887_9EURO